MSGPIRARGVGILGGVSLAVAVATTGALAQGASTPIQSPQDAACRDEARDKVFSTPDPKGLGLYAIGRQLYFACMKRNPAAPRRRERPRT
nr:hypothetical protein [Methylobacterium sp. 37f]